MGPPSLSVLPQGPGVEVHLDLLQSSSGSEKGMWWVDCAVLKAAISPKDALSLVSMKTLFAQYGASHRPGKKPIGFADLH